MISNIYLVMSFIPLSCGLLQVDKTWSAKAARPFDPYLSVLGEQQARAVAADLKQYDLKKVYVSPFLRCVHP